VPGEYDSGKPRGGDQPRVFLRDVWVVRAKGAEKNGPKKVRRKNAAKKKLTQVLPAGGQNQKNGNWINKKTKPISQKNK